MSRYEGHGLTNHSIRKKQPAPLSREEREMGDALKAAMAKNPRLVARVKELQKTERGYMQIALALKSEGLIDFGPDWL